MSELKTYKMVDEEYCTDCVCVIPSEVYIKSEADAVFAEKDKELRHQKYKRCLAMAELCHWKMGVFIYKKEKSDFYCRWHKRWRKLAEKFKEAK